MPGQEMFAQALEAFNRGDLDEAKRLCLALTGAESRDAPAFNLLGAIYNLAGDRTGAVQCVRRAIELDGSIPAFHYNMGVALNASGDRAGALAHFRTVHALDPKLISAAALGGSYAALGLALASAADSPAGARAFVDSLTIDPSGADTALAAAASSEFAVPLLTEVLRLLPEHPSVMESLAHALMQAGNVAAAREILATVDSLVGGGDPEATHIHGIYSAGLVATQTGPVYRRRRRFVRLVEIFDEVRHLEAEIAECGCLRGLSAFMLASRQRERDPEFNGEGFHIFDSFAGLSEPVAADRAGADDWVSKNLVKGTFAASIELVRANLAEFPGIRLYKGWIPDRFHEVSGRKFRFLNLDVDLYEPTKASIAFFYPRLVAGGIIVSDDYNWPGCRRAIEECRQDFGYTVELTAFDQAIIRKASPYSPAPGGSGFTDWTPPT